MKITLKTSVVSCTQQGDFIPLLLNLSQPYLLPCVLICLNTFILSTWEDPWEPGCQLVLFTISRVPSNVPSTQQIFNECLLNVCAPSLSRHCVHGAFPSHWYVVLITSLPDRYYDSYQANKIAGTQTREVTCSKLHSWWLMDPPLPGRLQSSCFSTWPCVKKESIKSSRCIRGSNIIDRAQACLQPGYR